MDEIEVEIVELELPQTGFERGTHVLGSMSIIPQLAGDPDVLSLGVARLERIAERPADLFFILIDRRAVDMPIADLNG